MKPYWVLGLLLLASCTSNQIDATTPSELDPAEEIPGVEGNATESDVIVLGEQNKSGLGDEFKEFEEGKKKIVAIAEKVPFLKDVIGFFDNVFKKGFGENVYFILAIIGVLALAYVASKPFFWFLIIALVLYAVGTGAG